MNQHLDVVTLGVRDLAAARRFYVDGLGWRPTLDVPGEIVVIQVGHGLLLSLFGKADLAAEAGDLSDSDRPAPISLGHIVTDESAVTEALERAQAADGSLIAPGQRRSWGGFSGYFADPDGYRWEVIHNPGFHVAADGTVSLGAVEP